MRTHLIHPHECPHCGNKMTVISQLPVCNKNAKFQIDENCLSFCSACTQMFGFTSEGKTRKLPNDEIKKIKAEGVMKQLTDIQYQLVQRRFKV